MIEGQMKSRSRGPTGPATLRNYPSKQLFYCESRLHPFPKSSTFETVTQRSQNSLFLLYRHQIAILTLSPSSTNPLSLCDTQKGLSFFLSISSFIYSPPFFPFIRLRSFFHTFHECYYIPSHVPSHAILFVSPSHAKRTSFLPFDLPFHLLFSILFPFHPPPFILPYFLRLLLYSISSLFPGNTIRFTFFIPSSRIIQGWKLGPSIARPCIRGCK